MFGAAADPNARLMHTDYAQWDVETTACHGGAGGYGSPLEFQKLLHSICADDGKLLKSETIAEMFRPQLTDAARAKMTKILQIPELRQVYGGFPHGVRLDWGLGGMINLDAYPGRSAGSMSWIGYPNLKWFVDRWAGMSGVFGSQIEQAGDLEVIRLFELWVQEIYHKAGIKVLQQGKL